MYFVIKEFYFKAVQYSMALLKATTCMITSLPKLTDMKYLDVLIFMALKLKAVSSDTMNRDDTK